MQERPASGRLQNEILAPIGATGKQRQRRKKKYSDAAQLAGPLAIHWRRRRPQGELALHSVASVAIAASAASAVYAE